jgi:hypothetical protein
MHRDWRRDLMCPAGRLIPMLENWQTWSAAMYLYAAACVEQRKTPFFDQIRG